MSMENQNGRVADRSQRIFQSLDEFRIELPSWGFSNTGTRFGKFMQPGAATNIEEKFADAAEVSRLTGAVSGMALHVLWDLPNGLADVPTIETLQKKSGIAAQSINPNLFQPQEYKFGSIANPDPGIRRKAVEHLLESVRIGAALGSRDISCWIPDGSNYPGSQSIRRRIVWVEEALATVSQALGAGQRLLIEYKPFEPAFYHTDIADWGMALHFARAAGKQAAVLVDTGHHPLGTNIEQIVAFLAHLRALGGFHFNDRKFADDDLTVGSIDPYQVFRIFAELVAMDAASRSDMAYMIDQSHNLKGKVEAMVQTVLTAQEMYAKALLIDQEALAQLQDEARVLEAEECLRAAFWTDVRPLLREWRVARNLPAEPLTALRESGYVQRIERERAERNRAGLVTYA